jgi:hypothetical protein
MHDYELARFLEAVRNSQVEDEEPLEPHVPLINAADVRRMAPRRDVSSLDPSLTSRFAEDDEDEDEDEDVLPPFRRRA